MRGNSMFDVVVAIMISCLLHRKRSPSPYGEGLWDVCTITVIFGYGLRFHNP